MTPGRLQAAETARRSVELRDDFAAAAGALVEVLRQVRSDQWDGPGLGSWTVRDLAGHASRALRTVEMYLDAGAAANAGPNRDAGGDPAAGAAPDEPPPQARPSVLGSPAAYFRSAAGVDPAAVAARGREAGRQLGADPASAVAGLADRATRRVRSTPDEAVVVLPGGRLRLDGYLPTRTFELTVHTLDLAAAAGAPAPEALAGPIRASLALAAAIAAGRPDARAVLLALTGRRGLPDGYSVV